MSRKSGSYGFLIFVLFALVAIQFYYNNPWSNQVEKYLAENPDKVIQALQAGQMKQRQKQMEEAKKSVSQKQDEIKNDSTDPIAGNPNGDVVVIEFFDYNCGYCKKVFPDISKLIEEDKGVKVVFKELPILSPQSEQAARAALAVHNIDKSKYLPYHAALMAFTGQKSEEVLMDQAKKIGIDPAKLKEEMGKSGITDKLNKNKALAQSLAVNGTPGFIIGEELIPGAIDVATMKAKVEAVRKK